MTRASVAERHHDLDVGGGLRLHALVAGSGPPLVMLHGFTGSADSWSWVRDVLAATYTTIAFDLPGHGRSRAIVHEPARYGLPQFADDLVRALDLLGAPRVAMLGYSLGGRAALHFAVRHADRLDALIVESASSGIDDERERAARRASDMALAESIEREGIASFVRQWERLPLWDSQRSLQRDVRDAQRARRLANDPTGLAASLRGAGAAAAPPLGEQLVLVDVRTLIIAGALDEKYVAIGEALARQMPRATAKVVAGAGHAVHLERAAELAALVLDFLSVR